jgi:hypothetical protein
VDTGFRKRSFASKTLERDADSKKRHPALAHDPEKWTPVFGQDHAQTKHDPEKWEPVFGKNHAPEKR